MGVVLLWLFLYVVCQGDSLYGVVLGVELILWLCMAGGVVQYVLLYAVCSVSRELPLRCSVGENDRDCPFFMEKW